jgi:hypothetical protein
MQRQRLGWLGPAIVGLGVAVSALGVWYVVHARPVAGAVIDTIPVDAERKLVVRAEDGGQGDRAFVELRDGERVVWQAIIPRYAGRPGAPGIAWSPIAVTVRVIRDHRAELFALAMHDASKLGGMRLAPQHPGPIDEAAPGPVTLTDHERSYELVAGADWHQLVAVDLSTGKALWAAELGAAAAVAGGVTGRVVWIDQGAAGKRCFHTVSGAPATGAPCGT